MEIYAMPVLDLEVAGIACKLEVDSEKFWVSGEQERFDTLKALKARVKKIKTTKYERVEAMLVSPFSSNYQVVEITRPVANGRAWITRADKSRETVDGSNLISMSFKESLEALSAELSELKSKEKIVREKIDNLPRASMPQEIVK